MGTVVGYLVIGLIAGSIAQTALPSHPQGGGWLSTIALGVIGALVGGFLGGLIFNVSYNRIFSFQGLITATVGSIMVLLIYSLIRKRLVSSRS